MDSYNKYIYMTIYLQMVRFHYNGYYIHRCALLDCAPLAPGCSELDPLSMLCQKRPLVLSQSDFDFSISYEREHLSL